MIITVSAAAHSYDILLERGSLKRAAEQFDLGRRVLIVTDTGVPAEYSERVAALSARPFVEVIEQGEQSKSMQSLERLLSRMVAEGFTRSDCVVAVGGGVVGDLAGFAAACYMRGIDFYNIPTTVLSQVDSSIGGKVAVDFEGYKNIVGAFYPPMGVIIDPDVLSTLSERQISNGLAESVKAGLTGDSELFELFERGDIAENMDKIIERSLLFKRSVVERDEREGGCRRILNFGHTVGHAIESECGLSRYYHGECVALGMLPMCSPDVRARLLNVLKRLNLPTHSGCDIDNLIENMRHDKKCYGDDIHAVFVDRVGQCEVRSMPFEQFAAQIKGADI